MIADIMGKKVNFVTDPARIRPEGSEVMRLCGDNRVITSLTPWRPQVSLRQGLEKTIDWFTNPENLSRYKPEIYNR